MATAPKGGIRGVTNMSETHAQCQEKYTNGYYSKQLEDGLVFQDIVTQALYQRGIVVVGYASRRFQRSHGENLLGAEIKNDKKFRSTGNVYIEIAEKAHPDRPNFTASGIMRDDNSWLYVIGDEKTFWIFATVYLKKLVSRWPRKETHTSIGHLMPVSEADKYAIRKIEVSTDEA